MKTHFKFTTLENSAKYVISIEEQFLKSKSRHYIFRTESQVEDFFRAAVKANIGEKLKDNGLALILFNYKDRELALAVDIFSNPEKTTTTIIKIKYFLSRHHGEFNKIYNVCPPENIADMRNYVIPTRIIVRDFVDIHYDTFNIYKEKINAYLSYFVHANKISLLKEYDISNVLQKIAGAFFTKETEEEQDDKYILDSVLDKEPFWIWLKEETLEDEDNYYTINDKDNFLCCLSLVKKRKNKKVFYELLLDQVHKNFIEQKLIDIKEYKEVLFEEPILIQKKTTKAKTARKVSRRGLKIVKKEDKK
jgi:hypothetical protein